MRIDAHQHFWKFDPIRDRWIDESMEVIRNDFLPHDLKPILEINDVDGCIAVQADQSEKETEFLLNCAKENTFIKGVVGWLDLQADTIEERLEYFSNNKLLKGVRHIVQAEKDENFMLKTNFLNGIALLEKFNLVYDILIHEKQLPMAIKLVKKFPNQQFVLDHIAKPRISETIDSEWITNIQHLAKYSNVSCKISGMVTETKDFKWKEENFSPFVDTVFNAFGIDRILFGSDWPVCLLAGQYKDVLQIIENYLQNFSKEEKTKVFGKNAVRVYNL